MISKSQYMEIVALVADKIQEYSEYDYDTFLECADHIDVLTDLLYDLHDHVEPKSL